MVTSAIEYRLFLDALHRQQLHHPLARAITKQKKKYKISKCFLTSKQGLLVRFLTSKYWTYLVSCGFPRSFTSTHIIAAILRNIKILSLWLFNLTLSHPEALHWWVKLSGIRRSKITKGTVWASLGEERLILSLLDQAVVLLCLMPEDVTCQGWERVKEHLPTQRLSLEK